MLNLVRALRETGAYSERVLEAMQAADRGHFSADLPAAYSVSSPARIHPSVNMTAADVHALALSKIDSLLPGDAARNCLDVGCGTGYVSTVLAKLYPQSRVLGIDVIAELPAQAAHICQRHYRDMSSRLDFQHCNVFDLDQLSAYKGVQFDVIHGGATAHRSLEVLLARLAPGGIMVFPQTTGQALFTEELSWWHKRSDGTIDGPHMLAPVMYTPLVD